MVTDVNDWAGQTYFYTWSKMELKEFSKKKESKEKEKKTINNNKSPSILCKLCVLMAAVITSRVKGEFRNW